MAGECTVCGALIVEGCACAVADTDCIEANGSGNVGNLLTPAPVISPNAGNIISCGAAGLMATLPPLLEAPPSARVQLDSTQSIGDGASHIISWDSETWDTDGFFLPAEQTDALVITKAGLYIIVTQARLAAAAVTGQFVVAIRVDSEPRAQEGPDIVTSASETTVIQAHCVERLAVDSRVSTLVGQDSGAARNLEPTDNGTWLLIHRFGGFQ